MSFTVVPEDPARPLADPGPPEACPHCGRRAFWRNGCYERHLLLGPCRQQRTRPWQETLMRLYLLGVSLWRDVQQLQAEAPRTRRGRCPGWSCGRDLAAAGGLGFDWTAYFRELEARGVHTLVTDDDPAFRKALKGCGLDQQLCVVHMRRTVRRRLQRMRKDRILPAPADAAVLQGVVQLVRELPLWSGRLLPVCCEWAHQGAVRQSPPVPALVEHAMERWNDLVRCVRDLAILPAQTGWRAGSGAQAPSAAGPRPEDAAGRTGLPASAGRESGLKPAGPPGPCQRSRACPPEPFSTKVK